MSKEWMTLREYVDSLLLDGKRSQHEEFKLLFTAFGKEKIVALAKELLEMHKREEQGDENK